MRLRLATWNTWKNEGDYSSRLDAMAAVLKRLAPDLVLLQECFRVVPPLHQRAADTATHLASATGLGLHYVAARRGLRQWHGEPVPSESGLAVLSRLPARDCERLALPSTDIGGERVALLLTLPAPAITLQVAAVHLSHVRGETDVRARQLQAAADAILHRAAPDHAVVIGGDFNCERDDGEWGRLRLPADRHWVAEPPSRTPRLPTHPVSPRPGRAGRCIDDIRILDAVTSLASPRPSRSRIRLLATGRDGRSPEAGHAEPPSDHVLVWCDLEIDD